VIVPVLPWLAGFAALGIGVLLVGGNSPWLLAFVIPTVIVGFVLVFALW
jgi:hypothetical protein